MLGAIKQWITDPPPATIVEISESGIALARLGPKSRLPERLVFAPLAAGVVEASPLRQNIRDEDAFRAALAQALAEAGPARKREAALLLPDNCARLAVLEFEKLPSDARERLSLIRWRLKKSVPFDADTASIAYQVQRANPAAKHFRVLVAVSPIEIVTQYEAPLRAQGFVPGYVAVSVTAALNLIAAQSIAMLVKRAGRILSTVILDEQGQVRLVRSLDEGNMDEPLTEERLREMAVDLYPTFVYAADNFGSPVSRLVLAGFGASFQSAQDVFRRELGYEAEALRGPQGLVESHAAGIWGYLSAN